MLVFASCMEGNAELHAAFGNLHVTADDLHIEIFYLQIAYLSRNAETNCLP